MAIVINQKNLSKRLKNSYSKL